MSKTFKSAWPNQLRRLHLEENEHGVNIHVSDPEWRDVYGITITPSDAPALALAILETAGFVGDENMFTGLAVANLRDHVEEQERITAESREQAELEAEALKLRNVYMSVIGRTETSWDLMSKEQRDIWLAVARKAREIGAEK